MQRKPSEANLEPADYADFERLGISAQLLNQAQVRRVTDRDARDLFGVNGPNWKDMSGIVFPYCSIVTGQRVTCRLRRDNPEIENGKPKDKYVSPYGDRKRLYLPPDAAEKLQRAGTPIVLVEAEKSVLALSAWAARTGMNLLPLGMGGCWGWRGRIGKVAGPRGERFDEVGPIADLEYCNKRKVYALLDSNTSSNPKVSNAETALVIELKKRACEVLVCALPAAEGVNGPDDYIAVKGDTAMAEVFEMARKAEERPQDLSDDVLATMFTAEYGTEVRYTAAQGRWYLWDSLRWTLDLTLQVRNLIRQVCRTIGSSCELRHANRVASAATAFAVERLAQADRCHAATVEQWDADPRLLNTPAGTVNLRTGEIGPADREDYCTKITAVGPGGPCPLSRAFSRK